MIYFNCISLEFTRAALSGNPKWKFVSGFSFTEIWNLSLGKCAANVRRNADD